MVSASNLPLRNGTHSGSRKIILILGAQRYRVCILLRVAQLHRRNGNRRQYQFISIHRRTKEKMRLTMKPLAVFALAVLLPVLAFAQYTRTDLVTNSGAGATVEDANLVNGWGLVSTMTSPYWVSDNATGLSTLYAIDNTNGVTATRLGLVVTILSVTVVWRDTAWMIARAP